MAEDLKNGGAAGGADAGAGAGAAAGADAGKAAADAAAAAGANKGGGTIIDPKSADAAGDANDADRAAQNAADKAGGDKGAAQPDWRARMAGNDAEALKRLARFPDETALFKSYRALEARLSSGDLKKALPDGATAEEVATWRKENGIPENEAGYVEKLALPNGLVLGEADKPIVAEFAKAALESNVDPKAFNGLVAKYYAIQDQQKAVQETADATFKQESEDALRKAWPAADFRQNLTAIQNFMAGWPEGLAARVLAGRTPDGRKLGDDPAFVQQMAAVAREINPLSTLVPVGTTDPGKNVAEELATIRKFASEKPDEYNADKKMQARRAELTEHLLKAQKRNAA